MTSIRKYKKWWKSFMKRGWYDVRFPKRLETIRQSNRFRIYIWHSRDTSMYLTLTIFTKSRRKRGRHEKKIL